MHDRINEQIRNLSTLIKQRSLEDTENNPAMKEIVKQIGMLALSLKNFEHENVSKIEKN